MKINLAQAWSHITPETTIDYPAGEHEVTSEIAAAAEAAGVIKEGKIDGGGTAKAGPAGTVDASKG